MNSAEYFDIVDENGKVTGKALRSECHGNPALIHRTVHIVVFHPDGRILLQKRNLDKDIQPGKWDTAVGGHIDSGENHETAVIRELSEELGISANFADLTFLMNTEIRNNIESENVRVFSFISTGSFDFQREEIQEVKFWEICELRKTIEKHPEIFTPNLIEEIKQLDALKLLSL